MLKKFASNSLLFPILSFMFVVYTVRNKIFLHADESSFSLIDVVTISNRVLEHSTRTRGTTRVFVLEGLKYTRVL